MASLQEHLTATCSRSFGGPAGTLFAQTITTVIAAHCSIFNDAEWPNDNTENIIRENTDYPKFDFIVIGAGTAGSAIASRLMQINKSWSVLLIEAGDDPGIESEVPGFLFLANKAGIDWNYKTYPDHNSCLGLKEKSCIWKKGKAMGGSSSINVMVYLRGHPKDYDNWRNLGNPGWGYNDLIPYFEKVEENLGLIRYKYPNNDWYTIIKDGWKELNFSTKENDKNEALVGAKQAKLLIKDGKRINTAKVYLKRSHGLSIMKNAYVEKINIDPTSKYASGVVIKIKSGKKITIGVKKEIIVSAGTIETPKILMLSGIGPKNHLLEKNIDCLQDLAIGKNMQDHILLPLILKTNHHMELSSEDQSLIFLNYMLNRSGPLGSVSIIDLMGFVSLSNVTDYPDIQFHHGHYSKNDPFLLQMYYKGVGYQNEIYESLRKLNAESELLAFFPTLIHPKSRGEITLLDSDPESKPIIKPNYFNHTDDFDQFIKAFDFILKLQNTTSFKTHDLRIVPLKIPGCKDYATGTNHYLHCYIKHMSNTIYHPVGTVKMGPKSDKTAVVDNNLLVHGINNLRVVDASIMPVITSANTMAPTLVIAEKAADIIRKTYEIKDEF